MPEPEERFQPHLFTLWEGAPWRYIDNLPVEWSHLICKCDRFFWQDNFFYKNPHICKVCKKVNIMDFCKCKGCGEFYIRNFFHPNHCHYHDMLCWKCCNEKGDDFFCCDRQKYRNKNLFAQIKEPKGVYRPAKLYTEEELYEVEEFTL